MAFSSHSPAYSYKAHNDLAASLLRILSYFDIFSHPLKAEELQEYCDYEKVTLYSICEELNNLVEKGLVDEYSHYYFLSSQSSSCVEKREVTTPLYNSFMDKARRYSHLIAKFPFVKSISISGSLSKGSIDMAGDIDYFIITAPNRLWVCRTLLTIFKKILLLNSRKYFCINYFVDTKNMTIPDKNVYTATEIAFLIPTYNYETYLEFIEKNNWIAAYYPNKSYNNKRYLITSTSSWLVRLCEVLMGGKFGNKLDTICMKLTLAYRKRKFKKFDEKEFNHRLRTQKGVSKHHPDSYQSMVLEAYTERVAQLGI